MFYDKSDNDILQILCYFRRTIVMSEKCAYHRIFSLYGDYIPLI